MVDDWTRQLYATHGAMVLRRARALLGDEAAAWDALHEVFLRALSHGHRFRGASSPTTWLDRITTNYCFNLLRDAGRRGEKLAQIGQFAPIATNPELPNLRLSIAELATRVPPELCEIAIYHHLDRCRGRSRADQQRAPATARAATGATWPSSG